MVSVCRSCVLSLMERSRQSSVVFCAVLICCVVLVVLTSKSAYTFCWYWRRWSCTHLSLNPIAQTPTYLLYWYLTQSKLPERLAAKQLVNDLQPELKSAYRPCHSIETVLLKTVADILTALDAGTSHSRWRSIWWPHSTPLIMAHYCHVLHHTVHQDSGTVNDWFTWCITQHRDISTSTVECCVTSISSTMRSPVHMVCSSIQSCF